METVVVVVVVAEGLIIRTIMSAMKILSLGPVHVAANKEQQTKNKLLLKTLVIL